MGSIPTRGTRGVAQLVECAVWDREAAGSSPVSPTMKIIDLTLPLTHHMPVYPGDPEVEIAEIHTLSKQGWNLRTLGLSTHLGTHANVPYYMATDGSPVRAFAIVD